MKTNLFKSMNLIRRVSGASLNLFRYAAKSCDSQGVVTATSYGASDEHPMSIRSASDGGRWQNRIWKYAAMLLCLLMLGVGNAWASTTSNYYASLKITQSGPTGAGSVYVANGNTKPGTANPGTAVKSAATTTKSGNVTMYWWVDINPGYNVSLSGKVTGGPYSAASASGNVSCAASGTADGTQAYTATATFVAVTVNSVDAASKDLAPTNPSIDYPFTVTFATSNLKTIALDLNKSPETADGKFTITSWAQDGNNVVATGKFNGGGSYGGASRTNSTTVSLQSKASGSTAKTCTVTANFPALEFVSAEATEVFTTTSDATKTGTATYTFNYAADDDFPTTPTIVHTSGSGAFAVTGYTVTPNFSTGVTTVTVSYSFNPNGAAGITKEQLRLTSVTDTNYDVTLTATTEAEATDDAKVIAADGTTVIYQGDWATAWTKANTAANAGCTLQVLRNVTGGSLNANQKVTNTFTLDLNGKILSANYNGSIIYLNTAGKTLTIKDSKTGGRIENVNNAYAGMAIIVNAEKGNLIFESGTLYCENKGASGRRAVGIYNQAGTTVTMNGGKIEVHGYNNSQGVLQTSNKNNNTSFTMNAGEIEVDGYQDIYGVSAPGKVNINDGTINVTATYSNCRGITLSAAASATAANCYWGTLTMKGGTINSTCTANADGTRYAYGIVLEGSYTASMGTGVATDGSHANKAAATGTIENATINVSTLGRYAYGVLANGSYQSKTNHYDVIQIKNTKIDVTSQYYYTYGVYANCGINSTNGGIYAANIELTNCDVTATTTKNHTAYCLWATTTATTIYKNAQPNYYGEYAGGATITVNSGTYTANTGTTTAYAIGTSARAKTTYGSESNVTAERKLGGNAEGYATLNIHGGIFRANAGSTTARAVSNGGDCTIDGGEFYATAGSSTADGIYTVSGKLKASGVKIEASATGTVYGVRVDAANVPYNTDAAWTGFNYASDAELNNLDVIVTARTGAKAYGVYLNAVSYQYTQSAFDTYMQGRIDAGKVTQANADIWAAVFPGNSSYAIAGKAVINGGKYTVRAATTEAYGIYSVNRAVSNDKAATAATEMTVKNVKLDVKTNGTTTACGIRTAGSSTIDGADIKVNSQTTTCYGMIISDQEETTVTNTKIDASGTATVYGIFVNATAPSTTNGYDWHGKAILGDGNDVTAAATSGNTSYAVYLQSNKAAVASGEFAGNYANGGEALITGGKYKATATGTTAYGICLNAQTLQGDVYGRPKCEVTGGKFWGKATGGTDGAVNGSGVQDYFVLKGGVYNVNTNLAKYIPEGYEEFPLPDDRSEYAEGYRYAIEPVGNHGNYVCQIGSTKYKTLEEALQVVTSGQVIYMIANYTMVTPGDYVLPSGATLLIPYKDGTGKGASTAIGNAAATTTSATTPSLFRKLTFGNGVNLICYGTIETSAQQKANGQYGANVGMPSGAYGQIHMEEGSHISMESGSRLNCWGYITGKGTINVKNSATVLEGFQLGDWCGGTNATTLTGSSNKGKAFPITHYFYQSIECPITYRPGAKALGSTHVNMSFVGTVGQDAVPLVGTSDAMFIMDNVNASEDTWVMKDYDEETDYCYWTINSGASIGNLIVNIPSAMSVNSADYILPICSNMAVILNYGEGSIGQHAVFTPGSKLIINKEGTLVLSGVNVSVLDLTEYTGATIYRASYSPTWGTTNPRSTSVNDAEVFVHGKVELKNNGGLYTSASGANIHSTNSDAGQVLYTSAAQGDKTTYYLKNAATSATAVTVNAAKLLNEDNTYSSTASTSAGDVWVYVNGKWTKKTKEGCFSVETTDKKHYFIQPSDVVEVNYPAQSNHTYTSVTGGRVFVWDEDCYWWEVETTPTAEGYFKAITPDHNGKYNYYYYDSSAACWKIKTITVTWNINGSNTNYSVGYGTKPEWLGATPTKTSSSSNYVWRWDGWTEGSDATVLANNDLPFVTENTTFTAHFYEKYYEYNITFKNDDGTILDSRNWRKGDTPSYDGTPTKNPTAAETYEFNGTWTPAIATVSGSATYVANYTSRPRAYTITFLNYDMSVLGTAEVNYNGTPTDATYKAAIAPSDFEPYKPDNNAYSFDFTGWRLQGASENGFVQVKGDQTYIAQFAETTKKYKITFLDDDGETLLHWTQLEYGAMAAYDGPATSGFNKQDAEWDYTFSGWTPAEFTAVQGPQTYTATYNKSAREYKITWLNWDGSPLKEPTITSTINYGTAPGYPLVGNPEPTRESSDGKTYEWDGWTTEVNGAVMFYSKNNLPVATGDATYYAHFRITAIDVASTSDISIDEDVEVTTTTVRVNGRLAVSSTLTTDDLILEATPTSSGEITGDGTVNATNVYYDLSNGTEGFKARTWYAIAVPWQVDVKAYAEDNGVYIINGSTVPVRQKMGTTFDLIYYNGELRATGASKAWNYVEDDPETEHIMYPGRAYMIYLTSNADVIRFERKEGTSLHTTNVETKKYPAQGVSSDYADWNGIANPATYHAYLNVGATENRGQIYNADTKQYELFNMSENKLVVGQPIFVQPAEETTIMADANTYNPSLAPHRAQAPDNSLTRYEMMLAKMDEDVADRIIVRMDEEKEENTYVVGQDLVKMGVSDIVPQMWIDRYASKMCINTIAPVNNIANYPLSISVQRDGEYELFIADQPNDETMLYLTYDGAAICNLSYGGYVANFTKGTNTHYGLRIVVKSPEIATGIDEAVVDAKGETRKVLINDQVFIIRGEKVYSIDGKLVK